MFQGTYTPNTHVVDSYGSVLLDYVVELSKSCVVG